MIKTNNKPSLYFFRNQTHFLKDSFAIHNEELFMKFSTAIESICYFTLEMDKVVDGDYNYIHLVENQDNTLFSAIKNHQRGIKILTKIFPEGHKFWDYFDNNNEQYYNILVKEKYNNSIKPAFTLNDFEEYAVKKHILALTPIIGFDLIFESKHNIEKLKETYTLIFKGIQMNDDIEDFNNDTETQQWTYSRFCVEKFITENKITNEMNLDRFEERVFYVSGIASELMKYSKECFIKAKDIAEKYSFTEINLWLKETIRGIKHNEELILDLTKN